MLRIIFATLIIIHGLIHLVGFAKEWDITSHQLSKKLLVLASSPSRIVGILWLAACILFVAAGLMYLVRKEWFWILAALALLISQTLIVLYWNDAKYGTVLNIFILVAVIFTAAAMQFSNSSRKVALELMARSRTDQRHVTEENLRSLPQPVQAWLRQSGVVGKPMPNRARILQRGTLRTTPDGKWMPFEATQYFSIDPPGFVWIADIKAATLISIAGRDTFIDGQGHMLIKPLHIFTAANSTGPEVDEGTLIRYLAEIAWLPHAAVSDYLSWEDVDGGSARVTMTLGGKSVTGTYYFSPQGQVTGFEAMRYGDFEGEFRKELWSVAVTRYSSFNGVNIGSSSEVTWKLKGGTFTWLRMEVTSIRPPY